MPADDACRARLGEPARCSLPLPIWHEDRFR
jgi:hypothetical protein